MYFENIFFLDYFLALKIPNFDVPYVNIYTTTSRLHIHTLDKYNPISFAVG